MGCNSQTTLRNRPVKLLSPWSTTGQITNFIIELAEVVEEGSQAPNLSIAGAGDFRRNISAGGIASKCPVNDTFSICSYKPPQNARRKSQLPTISSIWWKCPPAAKQAAMEKAWRKLGTKLQVLCVKAGCRVQAAAAYIDLRRQRPAAIRKTFRAMKPKLGRLGKIHTDDRIYRSLNLDDLPAP